MLEQWQYVPAYRASAEAVLGAAGFEALARDFHSALASMTDSAERMFTGWIRHAGLTALPLS